MPLIVTAVPEVSKRASSSTVNVSEPVMVRDVVRPAGGDTVVSAANAALGSAEIVASETPPKADRMAIRLTLVRQPEKRDDMKSSPDRSTGSLKFGI